MAFTRYLLDLRTLLILSCLCGRILARAYRARMVCQTDTSDAPSWPPPGLELPLENPPDPSIYRDWYDVCSHLGAIHNAGCECTPDNIVVCLAALSVQVACEQHCGCRTSEEEADQEVLDAIPITEPWSDSTSDDEEGDNSESGPPSDGTTRPPAEDHAPSSQPPSGPVRGQTCSSTCTSVTQACSNGKECGCLALPLNPFTFWRKAACGPRRSVAKSIITHTGLRKREKVLDDRGLTSLPLDGKKALSGNGNSNGTDLTPAQRHTMAYLHEIAGGLIPAPCNASYVSYACADSVDGIVHESEDKWLGALLPENATSIPPIPRRWLQINGITNFTNIQVSDG